MPYTVGDGSYSEFDWDTQGPGSPDTASKSSWTDTLGSLWSGLMKGLTDLLGLASSGADAYNKVTGNAVVSGAVDFGKFAIGIGIVAIVLVALFAFRRRR